MDTSSAVLAARDANGLGYSPLTYDLLLTLLVLVLICFFSVVALYVIRRRRRAAKEAGLPFHNNDTLATGRPHHRRTPSSLTAPVSTTRPALTSIFSSRQEKQGMTAGNSSPPRYPLPEIRIHFPEEVDGDGKHQTSRVVSVRVGENGGVGLEPVDDGLPPYQKEASDRFHSLDMDRIGGLKEKETTS